MAIRSAPSAVLLLTIGLSLLASVPAQAEKFYRWQDDQGVTHYSLTPPADKEAAEINIRTGRSAPKNDEDTTEETTEQTSENETAETPEEQETASKPKRDPKVCSKARENLETLQNRAVVRIKDEYGEYSVLDEKQREQQIKRAKDAVKYHCKG